MKDKRILVIGDMVVDHTVCGRVSRMSPEDETIPVVDVINEKCTLGGCGKVAEKIKLLNNNLDVTVASLFTPFCKNELNAKYINFVGLVIPEDMAIIKTRVFTEQNQIVRIDRNKQFPPKAVSKFKHYTFTDIDLNKLYDYIVVSDYNKGCIDQEVIDKLKEFKGTVFVDTKKPDLSIWNEFDDCVIKINEKEWNSKLNSSRHAIVVTKGQSGAELIFMSVPPEIGGVTRFPTKQIENFNVIGAGDRFLAGLVVKLIETNNLQSSIQCANDIACEQIQQKEEVK